MFFNPMRKRLVTAIAVGAVALTLAACDSATISSAPFPPATDNSEIPASGNIVETAVGAGTFNTLAAALGATGLDSVLADDSATFTVFAPTDAAFEALGQETIDALLADPDRLSNILLYHVISGNAVDAATATGLAGTSVEMANGETVDLSINREALFLNDSRVTSVNINATNGIIHVIDAVLLPEAERPAGNIVEVATGAGNFSTLVAALEATGLDAVLADESATYTVFAPTDDAFNLLGSETIDALLADTETLSDILLYHVISGSAVDAATALTLVDGTVEAANGDALALSLDGDGNLLINESRVTVTDIEANNGIIHVIDAVLQPPADEPEQSVGTIVEVASANGSFNTLVAALQATGLDAVLADADERYTVFAPNDAAFAKLGDDTINALLADTDTLSNILLYHVIGGTSVSAETAIGLAGTKITSANETEFALSLNDGALYANLSEVIATDVAASNGVIHVVDTVLLPQEFTDVSGTVVDVAVNDGRFSTLVTALQATGLDTTLSDHSGVFTVFAPTDDAFALLGEDTIASLLSDTDTLSSILLTHVISGATVDSVSAYALTGGQAETASGTSVDLSIANNALMINNATVRNCAPLQAGRRVSLRQARRFSDIPGCRGQ